MQAVHFANSIPAVFYRGKAPSVASLLPDFEENKQVRKALRFG